MKKKLEEKLIQLAFGDLDPSEASRLEAQLGADGEATQALESYRRMKVGLRNMSAVPEDQLSKERLRDAILGQGLKPLPPRTRWLEVAWMPATAFAIVLGVMFAQKAMVSTEPSIVLGDLDTPRVAGFAAPKIASSEAAPAAKSDRSEPEAVIENEPEPERIVRVASNETRRRRNASSVKSRRAASAVAMTTSTVFNGLVRVPGVVVEDSVTPGNADVREIAAAEGAVVLKEEAAVAGGPIVLIGQQEDFETGALRATEIGEPSNVVVGG